MTEGAACCPLGFLFSVDWMPVMRVSLLPLRAVCLVLSLWSVLPLTAAHAQGDAMIDYASDDAVMEVAIAKARASLPRFLDQAAAADLSQGGWLVKWAHPVPGGNEHIWVQLTRVAANRIEGVLANAPNGFAGAVGDPVTVPRSEVSDWSFTSDDGRLHGNYTTRVMLPALDAASRAELEAILAPLPEEN